MPKHYGGEELAERREAFLSACAIVGGQNTVAKGAQQRLSCMAALNLAQNQARDGSGQDADQLWEPYTSFR